MNGDAPISVIIPCRNAAAWLGEAIESVRAQTVRPMEIVLVDDASTDDSVAIARSFGPIVRVVQSRGRGCNAARYTGVLESRGQYIAFVDADDRLAPAKHERQLAVLEASDPFTIVHTGSLNFWEDGSRPPRERSGADQAVGRCTRVIFERNPICGASVMAHRSTVLALGNYDPEVVMAGDYHLSLVASSRCTFACVPEPLYHIRRHAFNSTNRLSMKAYYHWLAQEKFRLACPEAFAELPAESIRTYMQEPVIRAVKEAYWRRDAHYYAPLLRLAIRLAPDDPELRLMARRRWIPMSLLRLHDRLTAGRTCQGKPVEVRI